MKVKFLGQGFEATSRNAAGNYLISYLNQSNFHSFTAISAFASEAGVFGLASHILKAKQNFQAPGKIILIVGIDQQGTSKEALEEIMNLDVESYIFYQTETPIFHPKIYLFEGSQETKLIVGSSNLTSNGMFRNVEGSLLVEFSSDDREGTTFVDELKTYYQSLFDLSDPNIFRISSPIIADFVTRGIVPDETTRRSTYNTKISNSGQSTTGQQENRFSVPRRKTAAIPSMFLRKPKATPSQPSDSLIGKPLIPLADITLTANGALTLLWESGPLTERDLNIPKGSSTNPTGSMLFKKGKMKGIDQRHYFRDVVFSSLNWVFDTRAGSTHLEKAAALFRIVVLGEDCGTFALTLTHNPKRDTRSYEQKNSMTSISWGDAKQIIAKQHLIGKSAKLYGGSVIGEYTLTIG